MTMDPLDTVTVGDGLEITRIGYGAMQLTGPNAFGPPTDRAEAVAVLRAAADAGVTLIDTADFYGPAVTNELIREALHPYDGLTVATKVGVRRGTDGSWIPSTTPADLADQVHDNLDHLGVDVLDLVYLRLPAHAGITDDTVDAEFTALARLRDQGLIRHLGLSGASAAQLTQAQAVAPVAAVQNLYNLAHRDDDPLVDRAAAENIAYVSYFPLGGLNTPRGQVVTDIAARLGARPRQVVLAWLLARSDTLVVIPGTSRRTHLDENIAAGRLTLAPDVIAQLDARADRP